MSSQGDVLSEQGYVSGEMVTRSVPNRKLLVFPTVVIS